MSSNWSYAIAVSLASWMQTFQCKVLRILKTDTPKPIAIKSHGKLPSQYGDYMMMKKKTKKKIVLGKMNMKKKITRKILIKKINNKHIINNYIIK